jgi:Acetyltransferases, including N-acetylases of ribosomal proteins
MTDTMADHAEDGALPADLRGIRIAPMSAAHAEAICAWRYPPPYDRFNWPAWEEMAARGLEFGDPWLRETQYAAVLNGRNELIGYVQFFPLLNVTRLGLGLRPDLCGKGAGAVLTRLAAEEALRRSPGVEVDLEVLAWNTRAIRAYEKAGFVLDDTYRRQTSAGSDLFHCMVYRPADPRITSHPS